MSKRLSKRQIREQQELDALRRTEKGALADEDDQSGHHTIAAEAGLEEGSSVDGKGLPDADDLATSAPLSGHTDRDGGNQNLFAKLGQEDESASLNEESEEKSDGDAGKSSAGQKAKSKKKKKKKGGAATATTGGESATPEDTSAIEGSHAKASGKKKARGSKGAETSANDVSSMSIDELSDLLASQVQMNNKEGKKVAWKEPAERQVRGPFAAFRAHLALTASNLDPAVELRRHFGAAAIKAYENEAGGGGRGTASTSTSARASKASGWNPNFKGRLILIQPSEAWPPISRTFTGMTMETWDEPERGKVAQWVHSRAYRQAQQQFLQAVQSGDPDFLYGLISSYPWHIDSLLQLSEICRHQGDLGAASDWNARALFAYERTSSPVFTSGLTSTHGPPLIAFGQVEDRAFWIACHRHINYMGRRGTWRTALEWVKLMLGLDPTNDRHGMILWLDFLSIKSKQHVWFLDCLTKMELAYSADREAKGLPIVNAKTPFDEDKELIGEGSLTRGALDWCVGCNFAKALALRTVEKEAGDRRGEKSTAALRLAIARHPALLPLLFDKIGLNFPGEMRANPIFSFEASDDSFSKLLSLVYVSRSESLWREADVGAWLLHTLHDTWPVLQKHAADLCPAVADEAIKTGVYRHVLVSDLPDALRQSLIGLIPKHIVSKDANLLASDPIPPTGSRNTYYDDGYFAGLYREHQIGRDEDVTSDEPTRNVAPPRGQAGVDAIMERFFQLVRSQGGTNPVAAAMALIQRTVPTEALGQITPEMLAAMAVESHDRLPPGALLSDVIDDDDADEGEAGSSLDGTAADRQDEALASNGSFATIRRLLGNIWGDQGTAALLRQRATDDDEADEHRDNVSVD